MDNIQMSFNYYITHRHTACWRGFLVTRVPSGGLSLIEFEAISMNQTSDMRHTSVTGKFSEEDYTCH